MTGTNIPEGTKSLTRGGYDKLLDQAGIVADARLHDLRLFPPVGARRSKP